MSYLCKLTWGFGGTAMSTEMVEFHVQSKDEIPAAVKRIAISIARRHGFSKYEGRLIPQNPWVGGITITPVREAEYTSVAELIGESFFGYEVDWTEQLMKQDELFVDGQYNMTPAPENL